MNLVTNSKTYETIEKIQRLLQSGVGPIEDHDQKWLKKEGIYFHKPKEKGLLFLRVNIPAGLLSSQQGRMLARIASTYGDGRLSITTRQAVQFHNLRLQDIPDILKKLDEVALATSGSGGDRTRNITGNLLAGIDPQEFLDTRGLVQGLYQFFQQDRSCTDLPRKFKIALTASAVLQGHEKIQCLAFTPAYKKVDEDSVFGFHVHVGGGLSRDAMVAQELDLFVEPHQVVPLSAAAVALFRDYGCRENRQKARLKHVVQQWGLTKFQQELIRYVGYELPSRGISAVETERPGPYYGFHRQKQKGYDFLGVHIPMGRFTAVQLQVLSSLADRYGVGELRIGYGQNILITHIPFYKKRELQEEEIFQELPLQPAALTGQSLACTGGQYCKYSTIDTKEKLYQWVQKLDQNFAEEGIEVPPLRIHLVGCPHSCGHRHLADIGLQGKKVALDGNVVEAFTIYEKNQESGLCTEEVAVVLEKDIVRALTEYIKKKIGKKETA
ncbi:nitrite/sulfite reductase [Heliorestis convoluta]|uniref:Ferredoxin--nitrite reductase n=1 Tax=Heliorestis convoluta TaxID=356322 RepID=A0A5Q2MXS5_9FIRM|nr:nitrite/sulfite reductase [Heliorestis convoluta]QGG47604.1 Ferredoxin--nitrite reductase [Heliorestis convoluta]